MQNEQVFLALGLRTLVHLAQIFEPILRTGTGLVWVATLKRHWTALFQCMACARIPANEKPMRNKKIFSHADWHKTFYAMLSVQPLHHKGELITVLQSYESPLTPLTITTHSSPSQNLKPEVPRHVNWSCKYSTNSRQLSHLMWTAPWFSGNKH